MGLLDDVYQYGGKLAGLLNAKAQETNSSLRGLIGLENIDANYSMRGLDAMAGGDLQANRAANKAAAQNKLFELATNFNPAALGMTKYVRRSQSVDTPFNGVDYAMFKEAKDGLMNELDALRQYGPGKWAASDVFATPVENIQKDIVREIRKQGINRDYGTTAAQLAREAAPEDIVNSAGIWDNPDLVSAIYEGAIAKNGVRAVKTPDGLIVFDRSLAKKVLAK